MPALSVDTSLFAAYCQSRKLFLQALGCDDSCRDPMAEFSERLVCDQLGGRLADSRVQKGYDLTTADGRRVQVKYLANPVGVWRNGHTIPVSPGADDYAIVLFEGFDLLGVVVFRCEQLGEVYTALKKRHGVASSALQLGKADFAKLIADPQRFAAHGVTSYILSRGTL